VATVALLGANFPAAGGATGDTGAIAGITAAPGWLYRVRNKPVWSTRASGKSRR
jgi:hypothetical protein